MNKKKTKSTQIYETLKKEISDGQYNKNRLLPTENELINKFNASRNTIRKAIHQLNREGFTYSVKGRGVVVLEKVKTNHLFAKTGNFQGMRALEIDSETKKTTIVKTFKKVLVDEEISKLTSFNVGDTAYYVERIRCFDDISMMYDSSYFKESICGHLTKEIFEGSIYDYIENNLDFTIASSKSILKVEGATEKDIQYIDLNGFNCVGVIENSVYNDYGNLFEFTMVRFIPNKYAIVSYNMKEK